MQRPNPENLILSDILITEELTRRVSRTPDFQTENQAMRTLIHQMGQDSRALLQSLVDTALVLCEAGTAGVSLLETTSDGSEIFRWKALAGTLAHHIGSSTPRNFSPCGVCLEQGVPVLFSHPEHYFTYFQEANTPIIEALVLPLIADRHVFGTIWIISHNEGGHFDSEDVRVMTSLTDLTATTLLLQQRQTRELLSANAALEKEVLERKQAEVRARALISNLPGGAAFVVDHNFRYLLAEGEALATAGLKPQDFVGRTIFEALPPELAASYEPMYRKALAGEPFEHEHHAHSHTYVSRGTPLRSDDEEIYAVLVLSYDISDRKLAEKERKQVESALRESEARLATELADAKQLQLISSQLVQKENIDVLYEQILEAAIALMRSEMGSMQMLHPDNNELQLLISKGFDPTSAAFWQWVRVDSESSCGVALKTGQRMVVRDVETCEFIAGSGDLDAYRRSGIRAVQTTPLVSRSGRIVGMISTHWQQPHQPSEQELGLLDVLARQAADLIEQRQAEAALRESEAKYRTLFNAMDEGYMLSEVIFDENDKPIDILYLEANPAAIRLAGRDFSGQRMREIDPKYEEYWYEMYGRIALTGEAVRAERYAEPHRRWFDFYAFQVGEPEIRRVATVFQDITDRKRQEEALRESEERMRDVLNSMSEGFALLGGDFTILDVNEETLRLDGRSRKELVGCSHWDAFPGTEDSPVGEIFKRVARERVPASLEHLYRWPDGRSLWLDMRVYPTRNDGVAIFWRDVTNRKQAEAALRESEEKYRSLFNSMDEAYAVVEVMTGENGEWNDFLFLEVNPAFVKQTGMEYPVGRKATELLGTPNPQWAKVYGRVAETGEPIRFEEGEATLGRVFDLYVFRLGGEGSRRVAVLFADITDRKRHEQRQNYLLRLSDALRPLFNAAEIEGIACRLLGEELKSDRAFYSEISEAEDYVKITQDYLGGDSPTLAGIHPLSAYSWVIPVYYKGEPIIISDVYNTDLIQPADLPAMEAAQVISYILIPLIKNNVLVSTLTVSESVPRQWNEYEVALLTETAERIWTAVERAKVEEALREAQESLQIAVEAAEMGTWDLDLTQDSSGHRSLRHDQVFGYDDLQPEWGQKIARRHVVKEDLDIFDGAFARALETGELKFEVRVRWSDESIRWMACDGRFYFDANGKPVRGAGVNFDITDRKLAEAQLRRAAEMDAFRVKLSDALRSLFDPTAIKYQAACVLGEHLGSDRAYYVEIDEALSEFVVARDWHHPGAPSHARRYPLSGWPMPWLVDGQPWVVRDVDTDPAIPDDQRESYRGNDIGALIVVPLIKNGRLVATLATNQHNPRDWTADEITVVQETAERTWAAVERAYAEAALHESEQKYRTLFDSIDEGLAITEIIYDEGEIVDIIYRQVNRAYERHGAVYDVVGRSIFEVIPGVEDYWLDLYKRVARTGESVREENYQQDVDRWFDVYFSRIDDNGRFVAIVFSDISDRKRREVIMHENEARQAFLLKLSDILQQFVQPNDIKAAAMRLLGEHLGVSRAQYHECDSSGEYYSADGVGYANGLPLLDLKYRIDNFGTFVNEDFAAGRPYRIDDLEVDPRISAEERDAYRTYQIRAGAGVPLIRGGKLVAILAIHDFHPHRWTDLEMDLIRETAERIWTPIERARAEAALRESEAKYRSLFESINDGFALLKVLYDDDNQPVDCLFLEVSPSFEAQTTLPQAQGKTLRELIPSVEPDWFDHYHQALVTNAPVHFEIYQSHIKIWFEVDVLPYDNPQDRQVVIIFQNINERKQAEAERLQLIREQAAREQERQRAESLAELDRTKTLFFSNVSHEFRTPLTLSLAPLQDILSDSTHPLAPVHRERLKLVHRNSLRLLKLVNTLLDFSRIEAGRIEAVYEPTDLASFTAELSSVFRSAIEGAGLQLIVDCPPLPELVFVDREMWEKIVLNLLSNAFKFTFEGAITVRLRPIDGNQAILQIQDTGTGIAPKYLPHLFERFYQVRGTQARTHEGSGIGLALVHELVRLHGGTIEVNSTLGEGTCFTIALTFGTEHLQSHRLHLEGNYQPIRTLASTAMSPTAYLEEAERWATTQKNEEQTVENAEEPKTQTADSSFSKLTSARVLVIDDNADMREYLTRILSQRVQIVAVGDGATALSLARERLPDLILSDVMMPGLDGFELVEALRADPRTREIPIILLSARAGEEAIVVGLEAGADDYLIKPFSAQELISRVTAHLQMAQQRGEALQKERIINRQKDEFISVVSHELNTPLVSILGWTRLLRSNPPSPMMLNKALEIIERNTMLQAKLVQDLLDISRIRVGKLRLNPQLIELKPVLETAIATVTQTSADKGIHLTWQENVTKPLVVMGDRDRLAQVFTNLLTNAIKFTLEFGSVRVELLVMDDVSANASIAEVRVIDTGIGIAADFLPHVFERFRQAENENAAKGLGLGLAISCHIVELHNGTIHAQSAGLGQGSTFVVRLPLR